MKKTPLIVMIIMIVGVIVYLLVQQFVPTRMVIVNIKLDPPWQTAGTLSPERQKEQELVITETTDKILGDMQKNMYFSVGLKRYKYIPAFAITVSENAYRYLLKNPLVSSVEEDKANYAN